MQTPGSRLAEELAAERAKVRRELTYTGITALGLVAGLIGGWLGGEGAWLSTGAGAAWTFGFAAAYLAGGVPAARDALRRLFTRGRLSIDMLMVLAAAAAALVGEVRDGAILLFLFSLAESLEGYAMGTTKRAVASLMDLRPETANVVEGGVTSVVPVADVRVGQVILVRPGERVPLDGVVVSGAGHVDQSPITGESVPVDKEPGDPMFAGSVNGHAVLEVRVTKPASESTLARLIHLVTVAQSQRSPSQRFSDWFGQRYTVLVLVGSVVALGAFLLLGVPRDDALYRAATLLVVASPCAVVISVPAAVLSALARSARFGVLFKGGAALEDLGGVDIVAVDKTGTLTEARMRVTEVVPFAVGREALLGLAASVESGSEHPVAKAIVEAAAGLAAPPAVGTVAVPGKGVVAEVAGVRHWAGNAKLAAELEVPLPDEVREAATRLESGGHTLTFVGRGAGAEGEVLGLIGVADAVRPSAARALQALRDAGVKRVVMMTGDNAVTARSVAAAVGIRPEDVSADLLPTDKVERVAELGREGTVAFVGDGVNDAGALAAASVGVAMGAAGTDAALEAADVALLSNDLERLPQAHALARTANGVIKQNLYFALGIMALMVVFTLLGRLPLPLGVLGHEGGTILVVLNGLRLLGWQPRTGRGGTGRLAEAPTAAPAG
ncbi:MAG TPA: heavy metal translocating P-type ATPase [Trueperaceae bacterium]|jgi:heavy metal translocating P-type ATPase